MPARREIGEHVAPDPLGWVVRSDGVPEYHFATKTAAVAKARNLAKAKGTKLVVRGRDGKVKERRMYG